MAATASPVAPVPVKGGVAPLRAGQGYSFWLRRGPEDDHPGDLPAPDRSARSSSAARSMSPCSSC